MLRLTVGHSPDPDDAYMFFGFASGAIHVRDCTIVQVLADIETLNQRALTGDLEVTAISAAVYPKVAERYQVMCSGASIGRGYGPKLLVRDERTRRDLVGSSIAVPGEWTTAYLVLRLYLESFTPVFMDFTTIPQAVQDGIVEGGLVIHEAQLTYAEAGLHAVVDLGQWWYQTTGLPLPLGLDVIRRDLDLGLRTAFRKALQASIRYAQANPHEAVRYALRFGRGIDQDTGTRFVQMYVNEDTLDMGSVGREALNRLYSMALEKGLLDFVPPLDLV